MVEKELHAGHVHFLYTVYATSCIYIHGWYRETKMARGRRELAMGTETMKVPRGCNADAYGFRMEYAIEREYFDTIYIALWSINRHKSQMEHTFVLGLRNVRRIERLMNVK